VSLAENHAQLPHDESEASADDTCAICFEPGQFVKLPCSCALKYCSACWDRALATSVMTRGRAQCPSCRTAFKVDYDLNASSLVFATDPDGTPAADWRSNLYGKVKGVQIKVLEAYRDGVASRDAKSEPECEHTCHMHPLCACGAELEHLSSQSRIVRLLEDMEPGWRSRVAEPDDMVRRLIDSALVTCDLCESLALQGPGGEQCGVWTCKNGPRTVMHPCAYDVCEGCFEKYAGSSPTDAKQCAEGSVFYKAKAPLLTWNPHRLSVGCCQACSAVISAMPRPWNRRRRLFEHNA